MKTAVELFNQEIKELFGQYLDAEISATMFNFQRLAALTKAKEMEQKQILDAWKEGYDLAINGERLPKL